MTSFSFFVIVTGFSLILTCSVFAKMKMSEESNEEPDPSDNDKSADDDALNAPETPETPDPDPHNFSMTTHPPFGVESHGNDGLESGIQLTPNLLMGRAMLDTAVAELEITLYVGAPAYKTMGKNEKKIRDYLELLVHSANLHFEELKSPKIVIRMCGVYIFKTVEEMTFYDGIVKNPGKVNSSTSEDSIAVMANWQKWVFENYKKLPKCDAHILLTTEFTTSWASVYGFCSTPELDKDSKKSHNAMIVLDQIGLFTGARTLAHEIGHSLGSHHEGEGRSKTCGTDGNFVMTPSNFMKVPAHGFYKWSDCAKQSIQRFLNSKQSQCTFRRDCKAHHAPSAKIITKWHTSTITEQCKTFNFIDWIKDDFAKTQLSSFNFAAASPDYISKNKLNVCSFLQCYHTNQSANTYHVDIMTRPGTSCGKGKFCRDMNCEKGTFKPTDFSKWSMKAPKATPKPKNPTMTQQCVTALGMDWISVNDDNDDGVVKFSPDEMCTSIRCKRLNDRPDFSHTTPALKANDDTPCDKGKVCRKGKCVKK